MKITKEELIEAMEYAAAGNIPLNAEILHRNGFESSLLLDDIDYELLENGEIDKTYGNINDIDGSTSFMFCRDFTNDFSLFVVFLNGEFHHSECYLECGRLPLPVRCSTVHDLRKFFYMFMIEEEIIL